MKTISGAPLQTSQGPGPITAFAGAPAGGVVYASAAGLIAVSSRVTLEQGVDTVVVVSGAAGTFRAVRFRTAGIDRWQLAATIAAETGADAGTPFSLRAFTDAGVGIDYPIVCARVAGGMMTLGGTGRPITLSLTNQGLRINGQVSAPGVGAGTLLTAPVAGDPTFWVPLNIAGVAGAFPWWQS